MWIDARTLKESAVKNSPLACDVLSRYETLIYVQCFKAEGPKLISALSKLRGLRDVFRDKIAVPLQQHSPPIRPHLPQKRNSTGLDASNCCRISETRADGRAKFWAQERFECVESLTKLSRDIAIKPTHYGTGATGLKGAIDAFLATR